MVSILVVEDNKDFNHILCSFLNNHGYKTKGVYDGLEALDTIENELFDLIITDIMMPNMDGYEFVESIRDYNKEIPILFLSARDDFSSKEKGYNLGIDDYIVKPVNMDELVLKINALLKRAAIAVSKKITIGNFTMDQDSLIASYNNEDLKLSVKEFNILFKLLSNENKTFTRMQLMDEFWGMDSDSTPRTVDVYITKIREKCTKIKEFKIETIHGLGYKLVLTEKKHE